VKGLDWLRAWRRRHDVPIAALHGPGFVALDLETTGLDPRRDAVVAFAAIPFVGGRPGPGLVTLVNPGRPIPPASTAIHGITDAMVAGAPTEGELVDLLDGALGGQILAGHGIAFDLAVLDRARQARGRARLDNRALDTRALAAALRPAWAEPSLEALADRAGIAIVGRHTAEGDARAAGAILLALLPELESRGIRTVGEAVWFQHMRRRF
jgi:DNA polymerase III epsilon subunit-like protein